MIQVAIFLILNKEGKILVEKRAKDEIGFLSGQLLFPGGGAEKGEVLENALIREIKEELGIKPLKYLRLGAEEEIVGINKDVTLNPFYIAKWQGEIGDKILDDGDSLMWVSLEIMLSSPLSPTRKIAEILKKYLAENS